MLAAGGAVMKVFGLSGWSGSGKTTLMVRLLPEFRHRGLTVSTIKHAHHQFDIDKKGKDSYEHRAAGASEVIVASAGRWALLHENRGEEVPGLSDLLARLDPVDLVMVEGFKRDPIDKLEVYRADNGKPLRAGEDDRIVAVASDAPLDGIDLPVLDLNDSAAIADFIIRHLRLDRAEEA